MNILISGSSGLIGSALKQTLSAKGHKILTLDRNYSGNEAFYWDPPQKIIQFDETIKIDVVINLSGESVANGRWSKSRKQEIINSREQSTLLLSTKLSQLKNKPKLFISGSAIGFYGDTGLSKVDESTSLGTGFLSEVSSRWETASDPAKLAGIRTVNIRTGIVLSKQGGALKQMLLPFKLGLGGIIGNGQQIMSWVSINDLTRMIVFIINTPALVGPVNLVSGNPISNKEFTKTLGRVLHRPTLFPLPAFIARLIFGEMADALLLSSSNVLATILKTYGYSHIEDELESALASLLNTKEE